MQSIRFWKTDKSINLLINRTIIRQRYLFVASATGFAPRAREQTAVSLRVICSSIPSSSSLSFSALFSSPSFLSHQLLFLSMLSFIKVFSLSFSPIFLSFQLFLSLLRFAFASPFLDYASSFFSNMYMFLYKGFRSCSCKVHSKPLTL